jgi:hypothetical protein
MRFTRSVFALLATLLILGAGATSAVGATVEECQAQLASLQLATAEVGDDFAAKTFTSAVDKLQEAQAKVSEGKTDDAADKVADHIALLTAASAAPKPKVEPATAQALITTAIGVESCLRTIGAP